VRRLFALDQNFPQPIVDALADYIIEAELVPIAQVDERLATLDDWEVMLALHHHGRPWDGLITTDANMLALPRELAVLMQTKLSLVVAKESGHDPDQGHRPPTRVPARDLPANRAGQGATLDTPRRATSSRRSVGQLSAGSTPA
jgi:hypothetical protein